MMGHILSLILAGAATFAHPAPTHFPCADQLAMPSPIPRTVQDLHDIEMPGAIGRVYRPGETVPKLPPGAYLWLVNTRRELLLAPKYDVLRYLLEGTGLATHKGLLLAYAAQMGFGIEDEIVAGGQLRVHYEIVTYVSNKSGNYQAGEGNLDYGYAVLTDYGLPMVEGVTKKLTYRRDLGHTIKDRSIEESQLFFLAAVDRFPEARAWRDLFERFGRVLLDMEGTTDHVVNAFMAVGFPRNHLAMAELLMTYGKAFEPDGLSYIVYQGYYGPTALKLRLAWKQAPWYLERLLERHPELNQDVRNNVNALIGDIRKHLQKTRN